MIKRFNSIASDETYFHSVKRFFLIRHKALFKSFILLNNLLSSPVNNLDVMLNHILLLPRRYFKIMLISRNFLNEESLNS